MLLVPQIRGKFVAPLLHSGACVDQFDGDGDAITRASDRPAEQVSDVELRPNVLEPFPPSVEI
jgi:hypothetical protein